MKPSLLLAPTLGAVGLAAGLYLGRGPLAPESPSSASGWGSSASSNSLLPGVPSGDGAGSDGASAMGGTGARSGSAAADALLGVINNPNGQAAVNHFYAMLSKMPSQDIANLIVDVDKYPNHSRRRETREMIIDYLAMADPKKALEIRESLPNKGIFSKAIRQLGRSNPQEALRYRETIEDSGDKASALTQIFVGASEVDPQGAFELLKQTAEAGPSHYHEVFDNWAETDPTTAARMALTIDKPAERREALKIVGQEWAEADPKAVLDWLGETELSSYEREIMRTSALNAYAKRDAQAAMDLLSDLDPAVRNRALPNAFRQLIEEDPTAALDWFRNEPDGFAKYRAINESSWVLANEAPEEAIALAREVPEIKDSVLSSAFSTLAGNDLDLALEQAQAWQDDPQYANIISNIASGYGRKNPEEALAWANGLDENVRSSAVSSVISRLSGEDPTLAISHLDQLGLGAEDPIYRQATQQIASNWAHQDPVSASEWVATLPDDELRSGAVGDIADRWARIDPVSASEWIGTLEQGQARDQAAQRLVNRISREDPESAAIWAQSIGDENQRNNALSNAYRNWMRIDPEGARAAVEASPLPPEYKQQFIPQEQPPQPAIDSFGGFISPQPFR